MATTFIYALCEPGTRKVRYIGKTSTTSKKRLSRHLHETIKLDTYMGRWLRLLRSHEKVPTLVVLKEVEGDGNDAEKRYIRYAKGLGMRLVNATEGGEGVTMTPEIRKKIGDKNRGESNGMFGRVCSPEERLKKSAQMSLAHAGNKNPSFGKIYTEEESIQMSLATGGRTRTLAHRTALSVAKIGVKRSQESIAKQKETLASIREEAFEYLNSESMREEH